MAHIAYISIGMSSALNAGLEMARRLSVAGHKVTFLSHEDIEDAVVQNGYTFVRLGADRWWREQIGEGALRRPSLSMPGSWLPWIRERRRLRRDSIENCELESRISELRPDLLVIDMECHFTVIRYPRRTAILVHMLGRVDQHRHLVTYAFINSRYPRMGDNAIRMPDRFHLRCPFKGEHVIG